MKNRITSSVLLASGLTLLALPSALANTKETADTKFRSMDTNGDGKVSRAEFEAFDQQKFARMDANGDGFVTAEELAAYEGGQGERSASASGNAADRFKKLDADGDGKVSAAEHKVACDAMFARLDTDGDGYISQSEMMAAHEDQAQKNKKY